MTSQASPAAAADAIAVVRSCGEIDELVALRGTLPSMQSRLIASGAPFLEIATALTGIVDAVTTRLAQLAEARLGAPPRPYAWLACGSQARREQTAFSDQDNAMLLGDAVRPGDAAYFAELARTVNQGLDAFGLPRCKGGVMAENPSWRQPLPAWRRIFDDWIDRPSRKAAMHATIFFDMRAVTGDGAPVEELRAHACARARRNQAFLAMLASNAVRSRAPLNIVGKLSPERRGEHAGAFDVKEGVVMAVVDLARVHALAAGSTALPTLDRLAAAAAAGELSDEGAGDLAAAFELGGLIRARHQTLRVARSQPADNFVRVDDLGSDDRDALEAACRAVRRHQRLLASRHAAAHS